MVEESSELRTYVFTKDAVLRAINRLEQQPIHEHFSGYLAILGSIAPGHDVTMADITHFHDRYLRVIGASDKAPYVRPFKSRGHGLETFNVNVAGSYAPSSLRARGKLIDVIEVEGENRDVTYSLKPKHAELVLDRLLKNIKIPVVSLVAFLYRDYGFELDSPDIASCITLFREDFGLDVKVPAERAIFNTLFTDDSGEYDENDLEPVDGEEA